MTNDAGFNRGCSTRVACAKVGRVSVDDRFLILIHTSLVLSTYSSMSAFFAYNPSHSEHPLPQEELNLRLMVPFEYDMFRQLIDHRLLLLQTQTRPQLVPEHLQPSIQLLQSGLQQAPASLPQRVDGQLIARRPRYEVWQIRRALSRR